MDDDRDSMPGSSKPEIPVPGGDEDELNLQCTEHRDELSPRETADCAGLKTSELYEAEEDGGS
jgi:hypothetical protein